MPELNEDEWKPIDAEIFAHRMISAIKNYRSATGAGLKDAKDAVEARQQFLLNALPNRFDGREATETAEVGSSEVNWADLDAEIQAGRKISAIKRYRADCGAGLKDAKDAIDARERELSNAGAKIPVGARSGCLSMLLLIIGTLMVIKWSC